MAIEDIIGATLPQRLHNFVSVRNESFIPPLEAQRFIKNTLISVSV
jgi:hypothetical protein